MITLQTVPVDLLLNVGTYLEDPAFSYSRDISEITLAATLNDHDMLEHYMKRNDGSQVTRFVAMSGNLKTLKWVTQKGCPIDEDTFNHAAGSGNLKMSKWIWRKGCPWNETTCWYAARSGNLKMLKWLHRKGCPWNWEVCCRSAEYSGHVEMLHWLESVGHDEEASLLSQSK